MNSSNDTASSPAVPPHQQPLKGMALAMGSVALSLATFMNVLDTSIANVSLPWIAGDLGVSTDQGTWVITSFGISNAIAVPLTGWLTRRIGQVKLFTASTMLFVLASFLCALAPSLSMLILFRVLQGLVAGPMIPLSQALLLSSYPKERAGSALSMWAITTLVAPVVGPVLGGWITDNISWPWIFYINIPFGVVAGVVTWIIYRKRETPTDRSAPIDTVGLGLLVVWVGCLQVLLDKGNDLDWFNSSAIVTLAAISVFTFVLFLVWELTAEHPIVELSLFKRRNFWVATVVVLVGYGLYFGNIVLMPLWLQQHMGYTATLAGVVLAPVGILAIFLTPVVGRYMTKVDPRLFVTGSMLVFALTLFMRAHFNTDASFGVLMLPTLIQGIAMALFFIPLISLSLSGLPPARIPAAAGLYNFARITAGSFGTSIITTLWDRRATLHHSQLVESLGANPLVSSPALADLQARGFDAHQSYGMLNRLVDQQAFMLSTNDLFLLSGVLFLLMVFLIWLARPPRGDAAAAAASKDAAAGAH